MPGDAFKKVNAGDSLELSAVTWNAMIDAAQAHRKNQNVERDETDLTRQATVVSVKNVSGSDQPRFACLGIDAPIILPSDDQAEFANRVALRGTTPTTADHAEGRFVILLEPLATAAIGMAYAAGVCPVKLLVEDTEAEEHRFADIKDGTTNLTAKAIGAATILWKESVTGAPGVEAWAVIRLAAGGNPIRRFEMKDTVEEKAWDFDIKGDAYFLVWDDGLGDWKHEDGDPTAEVWGDRFLHGVAFGGDGQSGLGDRVTCWFDETSAKWWIIEGGQTFLVVNITEGSGISQGDDGAATISTADARAIQVTVKASIMSLTDVPPLCYCWWDDAGGGHWDGIQPGGDPGCGLKKDSNGNLAFDPEAVDGFGLKANVGAGEACQLDVDLSVIAGCGLALPPAPLPPILNVFNVDLAGDGLVPGDGCALDVNPGCGIRVLDDQVRFEPDDVVGAALGKVGDCGIDVLRGCGLYINNNNELEIDVDDLAGPGLASSSQHGVCAMAVTTGCGLVYSDTTKDAVLKIDLRQFDGPGLTAWQEPITECWGLQIDPGCGLEIDGDDKLAVKAADLAGLGLGTAASGCALDVGVGCGLQYAGAGNEIIEVDNTDLVGRGLRTGLAVCDIDVRIGCGIKYGVNNAVAVDNTALAGSCLIPSGTCSLDVDVDCIADTLTGIIAGCGLQPNGGDPGVLDVNPSDIAGLGLVAGTGCSIDVSVGCGLEIIGDVVRVKASDLAGGGLVVDGDCALKVNPGCGIQQTADEVSLLRDDVIGDGLKAGSGTCDIDVDTGCGLQINSGRVEVNPIDLAGLGLSAAASGCAVDVGVGCGLQYAGASNEIIEVDNTDIVGRGLRTGLAVCDIDVRIGCGIKYGVNNAVAVDNTALAGSCLTPSGTCSLDVDVDCLTGTIAGCGLQPNATDPSVLDVDPTEIAGEGLAPGTGCSVDVNVGCGLEIIGGSVRVHASDLAGGGLAVDGDCSLKVNTGCGIQQAADEVSFYRDDVIGDGLKAGGGTCDIGVNAGCGLQINGGQVQVNPIDLASSDITASGVGCGLKTNGFTGAKQVVTAIDCDPYDPYACPVAVIETWNFQNGLLKSVT
jgi:hypothetical protein